MKEAFMIKTLSQLFLNTIKSYPKPDFMLYKKEGQYVPISTGEWGDRVKYLALGLKDLGFQSGDKMILLSENSPEWVMSDFASLCLGGITIPIYNSLVPEQMKYIIDNSDARFLVCSSPELWEKIEVIRSELGKVDHFITFQETAPDGVLTLKEVFEKGKTLDQKDPGLFEKTALAVKPDDVASIIYTSGTTGLPKGVLLTHDNFMSNITEVLNVVDITEKDTVLSFLPLAHVLERMVTFGYVHQGCSIAYAESLETLGENLLEVRPHIMVNVPRVLEKIYAKVIDNVLASSSLKRKIFFWAVKVGKEYGKKMLIKEPISGGLKFKRKVANKLVFSKVVAKTGGRVRFFVSGGAALAKDIAEFFYAIGIVVLEGYGLTETSPVISVNTFDNLKFGTVGKLLPGVEVKIAEDGEILAKGPNIMKGYYRMDAETTEVMDGDWFLTGDIGHLDDDGFLVITDRKKDIIVTAGGKNVAPQQIENLVKTNPYISNIVVVGDQRKFISALVIPEYEKLEAYAALNEIVFKSHAEIDKGEITPSMKVKRNIVEDKYSKEINKLYAD
jgi:long-chain acyl-CoA synthetase